VIKLESTAYNNLKITAPVNSQSF